MGKKKDKYERLYEDERYQEAVALQSKIKQLNEEIRHIDEALAEMQIDRVRCEVLEERITDPFWQKLFGITKKKETKEYFAEPSTYHTDKLISLCEPELMFLRGFKAARIKDLNKQVEELSVEISED